MSVSWSVSWAGAGAGAVDEFTLLREGAGAGNDVRACESRADIGMRCKRALESPGAEDPAHISLSSTLNHPPNAQKAG